MKIQIKSDTHNEFYYNKTRLLDPDKKGPDYVSPEADVIVLAGDISTSDSIRSIVDQYGNCGKPVLYVAGNHDYWGSTIEEAKRTRLELFRGTNIFELDMATHVLGDVAFIGATLWSNLDSPMDQFRASRTKDFHKIRGVTPDSWGRAHHYHRGYITHSCASPLLLDKKKVVITHYLPSEKSTPDEFIGDAFNCIFSSNCEDIMEMNCAPDIWIHGHTHNSFDYKLGNTRVICNPFGYSGYEINKQFNPELIIEI